MDVTLTTLNKLGGSAIIENDGTITTITNRAGLLTLQGAGDITTLNVKGGTVYPNMAGVITTLSLTGGITDMTRSSAARTVTTPSIDAGARFIYDPAVVTLTNKLTSSDRVSLLASAI